MRKQRKKLNLATETLANLTRSYAHVRGGTIPHTEYESCAYTCTCVTDWFSCLGFTCYTHEFETCTDYTR